MEMKRLLEVVKVNEHAPIVESTTIQKAQPKSFAISKYINEVENEQVALKEATKIKARVITEKVMKKLYPEDVDRVDTVSVDIPLLIRLLEYAKEDAKTDVDLHNISERLIELSKHAKPLTMKHYDEIVRQRDTIDEDVTIGALLPSLQAWANDIDNFARDNPNAKLSMDVTPVLGQAAALIDAAAHTIKGDYNGALSDLSSLVPGFKAARTSVNLAKNKTVLQKILATAATYVKNPQQKALLQNAAAKASTAAQYTGLAAVRNQDTITSYAGNTLPTTPR
jgi:hypothetical protein